MPPDPDVLPYQRVFNGYTLFRRIIMRGFYCMQPDTPHLNTPWVIYPGAHASPQLKPSCRLFCFPYAGGGASAFRHWRHELPATVELACIQLPGRESRLKESPISDLSTLVKQLKPAILPHLTVPFVFFGHSMGALIAFELTRSLRHTQHPLPQHLFVSACSAPQHPRHAPPRHTLPEVEFIAELRRLKGTPPAILDHSELMALLLPTLKADFSVVDTYTYQHQSPLALPITALGGQDDPEVSSKQLAAWQTQTKSAFFQQMFQGDHFFIQQEQMSVLKAILSQSLNVQV